MYRKLGKWQKRWEVAVAHNIARELGVIKTAPVTPTLEAICMADFGGMGIIFVSAPVLPDSVTGKRRISVAKRGRWVSWN